MEKILNFKRTSIDDFPSCAYRFQCDCLHAADAMDVDVDSEGTAGEHKYVTLRMDFVGDSFFHRLKYAFEILRGHCPPPATQDAQDPSSRYYRQKGLSLFGCYVRGQRRGARKGVPCHRAVSRH